MASRSAGPGQPEVAIAIVTSERGVLIGRRRDGRPPWVFPGGKVEPGESAESAAVRETLEETGLHVRAAGVIGIRVHPVTGVVITYVATVPEDGGGEQIRHSVADSAAADGELVEVRWVTLAEADELTDGQVYEAVHGHLGQVLRKP